MGRLAVSAAAALLFACSAGHGLAGELECPETDLARRPDSPLSRMPYAEQGVTGTCYAFSGVFLADWYRFTHGDRSSPSSILFVAHHAQKDVAGGKNNNLDGGNISTVLESVRRFGVCDADIVNSAIERQMRGNTAVFSEIQLLQLMAVARTLGLPQRKEKLVSRSFMPILENMGVTLAGRCNTWGPQMFDPGWLQSYLEPLLRRGDYDRIFDDAVKDCAGHSAPIALPRETFIPTSNSTAQIIGPLPERSLLQRALSGHFSQKYDDAPLPPPPTPQTSLDAVVASLKTDNPQPVGMSYCAEILGDSSYRLDRGDSQNAVCGQHASVILGSRMKNGRCQLLVHNSWGDQYNHSSAWDEERDGSGHLSGLWIDADPLIKSTVFFEHL